MLANSQDEKDRHKTASDAVWTHHGFDDIRAHDEDAELGRKEGSDFFGDILVTTNSWKENPVRAAEVLDKLFKHGLTARPSKVDARF